MSPWQAQPPRSVVLCSLAGRSVAPCPAATLGSPGADDAHGPGCDSRLCGMMTMMCLFHPSVVLKAAEMCR